MCKRWSIHEGEMMPFGAAGPLTAGTAGDDEGQRQGHHDQRGHCMDTVVTG